MKKKKAYIVTEGFRHGGSRKFIVKAYSAKQAKLIAGMKALKKMGGISFRQAQIYIKNFMKSPRITVKGR